MLTRPLLKRESWADVDVECEDKLNLAHGSPTCSSTEATSDHSSLSLTSSTKKQMKLRNKPLSRETLLRIESIDTGSGSSPSGYDEPGSNDELVSNDTSRESSQQMYGGSDTASGHEMSNVASAGSVHHDEGTCKPCLFVNTIVGCQNGVGCEFCHLFHRRKSKLRPCKSKRERYRRLVLRAAEQMADGQSDGGMPSDTVVAI